MESLLLSFRKEGFQRFGHEVLCASIWMICGLLLCLCLSFVPVKLVDNVPAGVLFSVPYLVSRDWSFTHIIFPQRVAEWRIGRFSFRRLFMYLLAHSLGYMIGLVLFSIIPIQTGYEFDEVVGFGGICLNASSTKKANFSQGRQEELLYSLSGVVADSVAACLYSFVMLVLPEILVVNKKSLSLVSVTLVLIVTAHHLACNHIIDFPRHSMMNPIATSVINFGSWISRAKVNSREFSELTSFTIAGVDPFADIKGSNLLGVPLLLAVMKNLLSPSIVDLFAGSVVGALVGGSLVNSWLPDDPSSWNTWRSV